MVHNDEIAAVFEEIADLLEISGANPFRVRAYRNAARTVAGRPEPLAERALAGEDLTRLPGIGKELAAKIREIAETGTCRALERLRRELPPGLPQLLRLPGLGPKRVAAIYERLGLTTLEAVRAAALDGRLAALPGFGERLCERLVEAIDRRLAEGQRVLRAEAAPHAEAFRRYLAELPGVGRAEVAGSFRRGRETVGDLDLLAEALAGPEAAGEVVAAATRFDEVAHVEAAGETRATCHLRNGLQVDVRVVEPAAFGAALCYFTGSKAHNVALRRLARGRGLKVNEYGVFRGARRLAGATEEEVYAALGLPWIPPELREDRGELEAAASGSLPRLVELSALRGDLHHHTRASDGRASLEAVAEAARAAGLEYVAITDHSRSLTVAHGLDERRLAAQCERIDRLNERLSGVTLLKGIEVDILEDGSLDLPDAALARLDLVVAAVHSRFGLDRERQTERILRAMDRPCFTILAHPTGRLLGERPPYEVDLERVLAHAAERGCFVELNAQPLRLDLDDTAARLARELGVRVAISSDSHTTTSRAALAPGVVQARRAWLTKGDCLNTLPLKRLRPLLARTMGR